MLDLIRWYLVGQLVGLAALPLAGRAFRNLPDRGYAFARPIGLLVVTVALWFGCIFGLWTNSGAMVALLVVALGVGGWLGLPEAVKEVRHLWQECRSHILVVEGVFLGAFLVWAFCRAHFPTIEATEKPMEFGFLNGILRSDRFPPVDPWLSGNSISYYYLGYVLVAALTEVSGVAPPVAFNLAIATLFALTVTGTFGLGFALVDGLRRTCRVESGEIADPRSPLAPSWPSWLGGGIAAWFVALLGNLEGFLELLHAHGIGSPAFWQSLAVWHLNHPYLSQTWYPNDAQDNWWWFRATRVILDYPVGSPPPDGYNTINEFPFFSFLLGDLHPHVLALPYAFVCLAFALSFLRSPEPFELGRLGDHWFDLGFVFVLFGAMFLLNAWDILTYLFVVVCAFAARRYVARPRFDLAWLKETALFGGLALVGALLLYWPFYVTFRSQATGLLGLVQLHSRLFYFLLFWGPFVFLAASLVVAELVFGFSPLRTGMPRHGNPAWTRGPYLWIGVAVLALASVALNAPVLALILPLGVGAFVLILRYLSSPARLEPERAPSGVTPRARNVALTSGPERSVPIAGGAPTVALAAEHVFVFVLLFVAMLLLLGTEIVYLKDSFDNRMNTVFKLYFQAWEMLALVGAYAVFSLGSVAFARRGQSIVSARTEAAGQSVGRPAVPERGSAWIRPAVGAWLAGAAILIAAAFVYVPAAVASRSEGFAAEATLNGLSYYERFQPDDAAGIAWLSRHAVGTPTILEATGGSYSQFGRVAWMTGLPTVLGWDFHEIQWHGASILPVEEERKRDVDTIFRTTDARTAQDLLRKYNVTYVYVGPIEQQVFGKSGAGLAKFAQFMDVAYQNPGVTIYRMRGGS